MKQNIIQSIIRRGLSFVFLSLLMPLGVGAQTEYNLWIGGVQVTSENADNITGGSIVDGGTVSFDAATNTLTLNGVTINGFTISNGCIISRLSNLTISVKGDVTLNCSTDSCTAIRSEAVAPLTIVKGEERCALHIISSRAIRDFQSVTVTDLTWDRKCAYQEATVENGGHTGKLLYDTNADEVGVVSLFDTDNLPTPSMYASLNNNNEIVFGFEGDPDWDIRYSIDYVDGSLNDVTNASYDATDVPLQGAATVTSWIAFGDVSSPVVKGKLFDLSATTISTVLGKTETLPAPTLRPAIDPEDQITVTYFNEDQAQSNVASIDRTTGVVTILGAGTVPFKVTFDYDTGTIVLNDADLAFDVTVESGYPLTINNIQVTEENRQNVLNSQQTPTVQFDGQNTLILNNAYLSSVILGVDNSWVQNGFTIYLKGDNKIGSQANDGLVNQGANDMPLIFATSDVGPGTLALSYSDQPFVGFTPTFLNNLLVKFDYEEHIMNIATTLDPVVDHSGEVANLDGDGSGLGTVLEGHTTDTQVITADKKMLLTLGSDDGFSSWTPSTTGEDAELWDGEESAKLVVLSTEQNGVPEDKEPTTSEFATGYKGITMAIPAGSYEVACDYKNTGNGQLVVQVGRGKDAQKFKMPTRVIHDRSSIQFVTQRPDFVFLYNMTFPEGFSRLRAPGRKMANTTTLKSVKVSASTVAATPPPVLMPKVLTKDDVAAAKSGNHITITDTDVTDYAGDAFEGQTGITYVDLSATSITGKIIDRDELPASATVFLPASNDDNLAKNIVIAGVCNDLQLNDAVDFEIPSDFTAVKASLTRDFTSDLGKNCTVCVPFALDDTQAAELGTFYTLSAHSENTITMESVDATEANKAYMFKPAKETFSAEMVDVKKADPVRTTVSSLSFLGTYQQITGLNSTADFVYYCFMQDGPQAGKFVKITSAVTVNPFRAYMELPASVSLARVLDLNFGEGGATGIGGLTPNPSPIGEGNVGFYDLQGRRVLYPKKGLYILNGKKVIIK